MLAGNLHITNHMQLQLDSRLQANKDDGDSPDEIFCHDYLNHIPALKEEEPVEEGDFLSELMQATKHDLATMEIPDESRYMPERFNKPAGELESSMLSGHLSFYLKRQQYYEDQLDGRHA
jgi:hypothetical protein